MPFLRFEDRLLDADQISIIWLYDHGVRIVRSALKEIDIYRAEDCDAVWDFFRQAPHFIQARYNALVNFNHVIEITYPNEDDIRLVFRNTTAMQCCEEFRQSVRLLVANLETIPVFTNNQKLVSLSDSAHSKYHNSRKTRIETRLPPVFAKPPQQIREKTGLWRQDD